MKLDEVTKEAIVEIQQEVLAETGLTLSLQEIAEIAESQFVSANLAFKKGLEVRLPVIGTFVRKHGLEKGLAAQKLNSLKGVLDEDTFKQKILEAKLANKARAKERRKNQLAINLKTLKGTKNIVNVRNKYDKLL